MLRNTQDLSGKRSGLVMCVSGGQRTVMSSSKTSQRLFCIRRENPFTLNGQEGKVFSLHQSQSNYIWILHGGIMGGNDE